MRKRRHVFVSLINCNEFDSTERGKRKGGEPQEGLTKPQGDRKEAALLLLSCHLPLSLCTLRYQKKPNQARLSKGFRQRVARQMREHPKEKQKEKNHLKYFANKFKSQTGKQRHRRRGRRGQDGARCQNNEAAEAFSRGLIKIKTNEVTKGKRKVWRIYNTPKEIAKINKINT